MKWSCTTGMKKMTRLDFPTAIPERLMRALFFSSVMCTSVGMLPASGYQPMVRLVDDIRPSGKISRAERPAVGALNAGLATVIPDRIRLSPKPDGSLWAHSAIHPAAVLVAAGHRGRG